jgi:hypothetical protein
MKSNFELITAFVENYMAKKKLTKYIVSDIVNSKKIMRCGLSKN